MTQREDPSDTYKRRREAVDVARIEACAARGHMFAPLNDGRYAGLLEQCVHCGVARQVRT